MGWGYNTSGQCDVPEPNEGFVAVAGGGYHSLGLKADGSIVGWGLCVNGQCSVPEPNEDFVAVAGGGYHSLGLKRDGMILAWGYNANGQCSVPEPNGDFVSLAGGGSHSLGIRCETHLYVLQPDGSGDFPTIQAALNAAAPRDTVELADGTYTGTGNRDLDFLGKAVVLRSQSGDPRLCTIECQGSPESLHRGVHFQAGEGYDTRVEGITIAHGYAPNTDGGGGIFCDGSGGPASPTLSDCIFLDNMALYGGGRGGAMYVTHNSSPRVEGCTFLAGSAHYGGGIYAYRSGLQVDSSTFYYVWEGSCQGSAIVSDSATVGVTNCILSFSPNGRAVGCYGDGTVTLSCCDVYGNAGGDYVGCIAGQQGVDGNISLNPLFCDAPAGDLTLESGSPCAEENNPGCGRIGAWPVGCEGSSGVGDGRIVTVLYLDPPVPNPSQSTLGITYGLPGETEALVQLSIFDASGRRVRTLVNGLQKPGAYRLTWDGADESRAPVASGVYFMKLSWESQTIARRVLLLR